MATYPAEINLKNILIIVTHHMKINYILKELIHKSYKIKYFI